MNREIKFRAWDKKGEYMCNRATGCYDTLGCEPSCSFMVASFGELVEHDDCILMQYTGLKDKNGVEIYEGDILQRKGHKYKHQIIWHEQSAGFNLAWVYDSLTSEYQIEVIGNIYENPDLIRGNTKKEGD